MLAIRLGRALVVNDNDFGVFFYNFSAVLPLIDIAVPARLGWPATSTHVVATDHRQLPCCFCIHKSALSWSAG